MDPQNNGAGFPSPTIPTGHHPVRTAALPQRRFTDTRNETESNPYSRDDPMRAFEKRSAPQLRSSNELSYRKSGASRPDPTPSDLLRRQYVVGQNLTHHLPPTCRAGGTWLACSEQIIFLRPTAQAVHGWPAVNIYPLTSPAPVTTTTTTDNYRALNLQVNLERDKFEGDKKSILNLTELLV